MILAQISKLVVAIILVSCFLAFFTAFVSIIYHHVKLLRQLYAEWAKKGVKLRFFWNPNRYLIQTPEYNKVRNKVNKVNLICVIIMLLSVAVFLLIAFLVEN